jgi:hypothetical protein
LQQFSKEKARKVIDEDKEVEFKSWNLVNIEDLPDNEQPIMSETRTAGRES